MARHTGKHRQVESTWSEKEAVRAQWKWKVPENTVMRQAEGQAYWVNWVVPSKCSYAAHAAAGA